MFNPLIIIYGIFLICFLLGSLAVVYHLVKYQLNARAMIVTTTLFIVGVAILLLVNVIAFFQVDWSQFTIILNG